MNEINLMRPTGNTTIYALPYNATNQVWNGTAFIDLSASSDATWSAGKIHLTEPLAGSGVYTNAGVLPTGTDFVYIFAAVPAKNLQPIAVQQVGPIAADASIPPDQITDISDSVIAAINENGAMSPEQALNLARLAARFCGTDGRVVLDTSAGLMTVYKANGDVLFKQAFSVNATQQVFQPASQ